MGRKGVWGEKEYGAERRLGRKGVWGAGPGAQGRLGRKARDGSMGRKGGWGGREYGAEEEYGAEGRMGRKGVWGGRESGALGTSRHTILHLHPQATTFLSPPGGIYLIKRPGGP